MLRVTKVLIFLVFIMFIADAANSILFNLGINTAGVSVYIRLFVELFYILLLLRTRNGLPMMLIIFLFFMIFTVGSLSYMDVHESRYDLYENFKILNKMLFVFLSWEIINNYFYSRDAIKSLQKVFGIIVLIQSVVIILAFIFEIDIFAAYLRINDAGDRYISRFGYQGLIPAQNEASAFYILGFFYLLYKLKNQPTMLNGLLLVIVTSAAVLSGTKVTLILPIYLLVFFGWEIFITRRKYSKRIFLGVFVIVLILLAVMIINIETVINLLEPTIQYYTYRINSDGGISPLYAIFGARFSKASILYSRYISVFKIPNYLFGGVDLTQAASEMDFIDIFARFGLIGFLLYYALYFRMIFFKPNRVSPLRFLFIVTWLTVSTFSGHIAYTAINGTYLAILLKTIDHYERENYALKNTEKDHLHPLGNESQLPAPG